MMEKQTLHISGVQRKTYLGLISEQFAISQIIQNHKQLVQEIYPDIDESSRIQIFNTHSTDFTQKPIGHTGRKGNKKVIYGWHGDLVLLINSKEHGKRAIVFEIKYGSGRLTNGQKEFFKTVLKGHPSDFMKKLNDIRIYIVHLDKFDMKQGKVDMEFIEYSMAYRRFNHKEMKEVAI